MRIDGGAEAEGLGRRPHQDGSGVGRDLAVGRGNLDFGRALGYLHFASASSVGEMVSLVAPFSLLRRPFLWISASQLTDGSE